MLKEVGPWFYALVIGALYVSGFLALNSNLAKVGIQDMEFIDARYFLAGASFIFYLVCFYLFAGRAVLFTPRWLREDLERVNKDGTKHVWSFIVFIHSLITGAFFCCLSAALFATFAIGSEESEVFYMALAAAFVVLYSFDVLNLDLRYPRTTEAVTILAKSGATYEFFSHIGSGAMLTAFFSYAAIFFFINLVLDQFTRFKITADRLTFCSLYAVVFFLVTAIAYGTLFYGQVTPKIGGARPMEISLGLSEIALKALPPTLAASAAHGLSGKLLHQTPAYTYVGTSGRTVRLRSADIVALISSPETEKIYWKKEIEASTSTATGKPVTVP